LARGNVGVEWLRVVRIRPAELELLALCFGGVRHAESERYFVPGLLAVIALGDPVDARILPVLRGDGIERDGDPTGPLVALQAIESCAFLEVADDDDLTILHALRAGLVEHLHSLEHRGIELRIAPAGRDGIEALDRICGAL